MYPQSLPIPWAGNHQVEVLRLKSYPFSPAQSHRVLPMGREECHMIEVCLRGHRGSWPGRCKTSWPGGDRPSPPSGTLPCLSSEPFPGIPATTLVGASGNPGWGHPCSQHMPQPLMGCDEQTVGPCSLCKGLLVEGNFRGLMISQEGNVIMFVLPQNSKVCGTNDEEVIPCCWLWSSLGGLLFKPGKGKRGHGPWGSQATTFWGPVSTGCPLREEKSKQPCFP